MVQSAEQDRQQVLHKQDLRETRDREVNQLERQGQLNKLEELEREHVRLKANQTVAEVSYGHGGKKCGNQEVPCDKRIICLTNPMKLT